MVTICISTMMSGLKVRALSLSSIGKSNSFLFCFVFTVYLTFTAYAIKIKPHVHQLSVTYRLDVGDGKEINLEKCSRTLLQRQCIKYLGPVSFKLTICEKIITV